MLAVVLVDWPDDAFGVVDVTGVVVVAEVTAVAAVGEVLVLVAVAWRDEQAVSTMLNTSKSTTNKLIIRVRIVSSFRSVETWLVPGAMPCPTSVTVGYDTPST